MRAESLRRIEGYPPPANPRSTNARRCQRLGEYTLSLPATRISRLWQFLLCLPRCSSSVMFHRVRDAVRNCALIHACGNNITHRVWRIRHDLRARHTVPASALGFPLDCRYYHHSTRPLQLPYLQRRPSRRTTVKHLHVFYSLEPVSQPRFTHRLKKGHRVLCCTAQRKAP